MKRSSAAFGGGMCGVKIVLWLLAIAGLQVLASEFPERECCDLPSPQPSEPPTTTQPSSTARPGRGFIQILAFKLPPRCHPSQLQNEAGRFAFYHRNPIVTIYLVRLLRNRLSNGDGSTSCSTPGYVVRKNYFITDCTIR